MTGLNHLKATLGTLDRLEKARSQGVWTSKEGRLKAPTLFTEDVFQGGYEGEASACEADSDFIAFAANNAATLSRLLRLAVDALEGMAAKTYRQSLGGVTYEGPLGDALRTLESLEKAVADLGLFDEEIARPE